MLGSPVPNNASTAMKVFVAIANHGIKNDKFLKALLAEYASMPYDVHVSVLTNVPKDLGSDIEVVMHTPQGNPWAFPFAHKRILADRVHDYDLFIYSEDDTLITKRNIEAFLRVTQVLPDNEIAGFIRSERTPAGTINFSTVHGHFHWDPFSVVSRGGYTFAFFTNEHSAAYILTRAQLKRVIASGRFLVGPHEGKYALPETAATDPYTQCGLRKMICISEIDDFVLPHLPNKYVDKFGLSDVEFSAQLRALQAILDKVRPATVLMKSETNLMHLKWSKSYYEPPRRDVLQLIPTHAHTLLSFGCGSGEIEGELKKRGLDVSAVALDSVIGICAEAKGVNIVYGNCATALAALSNKRFDCVLVSNILHLIPEPELLLSSLRALLIEGGIIIAIVPNLSQLPVLWHRFTGQPGHENLGDFNRVGIHETSYRIIVKWFSTVGLKVAKSIPVLPRRAKRVSSILGRLVDRSLASEFVVVGTADQASVADPAASGTASSYQTA